MTNIAHLLRFTFIVFGVTFIVTQSQIFEPFRSLFSKLSFFGKLIRCPMCFGFWVGALVHVTGFGLLVFHSEAFAIPLEAPRACLRLLFDGAAGTTAAWTWYLVCDRLERP